MAGLRRLIVTRLLAAVVEILKKALDTRDGQGSGNQATAFVAEHFTGAVFQADYQATRTVRFGDGRMRNGWNTVVKFFLGHVGSQIHAGCRSPPIAVVPNDVEGSVF